MRCLPGDESERYRREVRSASVPVLLYHSITDTPEGRIAPFAVSPTAFQHQLDLLVGAGYRCITFSELIELRRSGGGSDGNAASDSRDGQRIAVITFDDGYADFATAALPALHARSLPSTMYLTTAWLRGARGCDGAAMAVTLDWSQLPELIAAGVELGAHSHSHPELDTLGASALREELTKPKQLLEEALSRRVLTFAYPYGYNSPRVRRLTKAVGYESAAAVRNGVSPPDEDPFYVSRLTVTRATTSAQFSSWLSGAEGARRRQQESLATKGWRAYRRGRVLVQGSSRADHQ